MNQHEVDTLWSRVLAYVDTEAHVIALREAGDEPSAEVGNRYAQVAEGLRKELTRAAQRRAGVGPELEGVG